jgi:hypothetical protein
MARRKAQQMSTKVRWTTNNQHYDEIIAAQNAAITGKQKEGVLDDLNAKLRDMATTAHPYKDTAGPYTEARKLTDGLEEIHGEPFKLRTVKRNPLGSKTYDTHRFEKGARTGPHEPIKTTAGGDESKINPKELRTSAGGGVTYSGSMSDFERVLENARRVELSDLYPDNEWLRRNFRDRYELFNDDPNDWVHSLLAWFTSEFRLQRTQVSRADALRQHIKSFRPNCGWIDGVPITPISQMWERDHQAHIFLIQHDWAAAFAGDSEFDGKANESQLPAPTCFFEYTVSGRHVIAVAPSRGHDDPLGLAIAIPKCPTMDHSGWFIKGNNSRGSTFDIFGPDADAAWQGHRCLGQFLNHQVRAASIALEAEVAETEVVRVPFKLNVARARRGQTKLSDYHVLNLANRKRYTRLPDDLVSGEKRRSPRLHFRRGHRRHYENYFIWIKWQLVGNPDIGFIDKDYRL